MFTSADDVDGGPTPFWRQRGWLLAAGFLAVVLLMALTAAATGGGGSGQLASTTAEGPLTRAAADTSGRPQGCGTDDRDQSTSTAPPKDVRWRTIGGTRVPVSPTAGPTRSTGSVLWCFAHTPMGAVMAAHVIPAQMTSPDWRAVTRDQVVPGFGRNLFVSQRASIPESSIRTRQNGTYAGFLVSDFTRTSATVDVLIKSPAGQYFSTSVDLRWSGGDWKVQPASDGGLHSELSTVDGTNGYVLWKV
ncbi:hypothetical protein ABZ608_41220 [Streptomyces sp. NPDC013172]|uniref:hypothetical protein n=1 Tax=unclassified Streptomyces TaxID=2593676 RepID=UPI0034010B48